MKRLDYDPKTDALYLRLKGGKVSDSESLNDDIVIDYDENNCIIGFEILRARENAPELLVEESSPNSEFRRPTDIPPIYSVEIQKGKFGARRKLKRDRLGHQRRDRVQ